MTTQQITVKLPEEIFRQLAHIAEVTQQPLETLVAQSIISNLPPFPDKAPPEIQAELLQLQALNIDELLHVARSQVDASQDERHQYLLKKNQVGQLTSAEQQELTELRTLVDRLMLRKAYAWSVLRWRGYRLPALAELPV
jgi:predicted transcriptional regulator